MKKIVVTGGTSFIGVHLIEALLSSDNMVFAIIRPNSVNTKRLKSHKNLNIIECSLETIDDIAELLPTEIDAFYHLAWEGARKPLRDNEELQRLNYNAALKCFEIARVLHAKIFIGAGSQAEYGKTIGDVDEEYCCIPITAYGKFKLRAGNDIRLLGEKNNIKVIWPRIFSVYGKYDYSGTLIMSAIKNMQESKTLDMTVGIQSWNYLYIKDAAKMLMAFLNEEFKSGIYNLASTDNRQLKEYIIQLKELLQSESLLNFGVVPYGTEGVVSFKPEVNKFLSIDKAFGFTKFEDGINDMLGRSK